MLIEKLVQKKEQLPKKTKIGHIRLGESSHQSRYMCRIRLYNWTKHCELGGRHITFSHYVSLHLLSQAFSVLWSYFLFTAAFPWLFIPPPPPFKVSSSSCSFPSACRASPFSLLCPSVSLGPLLSWCSHLSNGTDKKVLNDREEDHKLCILKNNFVAHLRGIFFFKILVWK